MLFSWHKVIAVISITERSFEVTSWYVSDSWRRAFGFRLGSSSKTPSTFVAFSTTSALTVGKMRLIKSLEETLTQKLSISFLTDFQHNEELLQYQL